MNPKVEIQMYDGWMVGCISYWKRKKKIWKVLDFLLRYTNIDWYLI